MFDLNNLVMCVTNRAMVIIYFMIFILVQFIYSSIIFKFPIMSCSCLSCTIYIIIIMCCDFTIYLFKTLNLIHIIFIFFLLNYTKKKYICEYLFIKKLPICECLIITFQKLSSFNCNYFYA